MISIIAFFNLEPIVAGNFVLETVGDLESQPALAGAGCLFSSLESLITATTRYGVKRKIRKRGQAYIKAAEKEHKDKRCLLTQDLKPFRAEVKGKHSIGRELLSLQVSKVSNLYLSSENNNLKFTKLK